MKDSIYSDAEEFLSIPDVLGEWIEKLVKENSESPTTPLPTLSVTPKSVEEECLFESLVNEIYADIRSPRENSVLDCIIDVILELSAIETKTDEMRSTNSTKLLLFLRLYNYIVIKTIDNNDIHYTLLNGMASYIIQTRIGPQNYFAILIIENLLMLMNHRIDDYEYTTARVNAIARNTLTVLYSQLLFYHHLHRIDGNDHIEPTLNELFMEWMTISSFPIKSREDKNDSRLVLIDNLCTTYAKYFHPTTKEFQQSDPSLVLHRYLIHSLWMHLLRFQRESSTSTNRSVNILMIKKLFCYYQKLIMNQLILFANNNNERSQESPWSRILHGSDQSVLQLAMFIGKEILPIHSKRYSDHTHSEMTATTMRDGSVGSLLESTIFCFDLRLLTLCTGLFYQLLGESLPRKSLLDYLYEKISGRSVFSQMEGSGRGSSPADGREEKAVIDECMDAILQLLDYQSPFAALVNENTHSCHRMLLIYEILSAIEDLLHLQVEDEDRLEVISDRYRMLSLLVCTWQCYLIFILRRETEEEFTHFSPLHAFITRKKKNQLQHHLQSVQSAVPKGELPQIDCIFQRLARKLQREDTFTRGSTREFLNLYFNFNFNNSRGESTTLEEDRHQSTNVAEVDLQRHHLWRGISEFLQVCPSKILSTIFSIESELEESLPALINEHESTSDDMIVMDEVNNSDRGSGAGRGRGGDVGSAAPLTRLSFEVLISTMTRDCCDLRELLQHQPNNFNLQTINSILHALLILYQARLHRSAQIRTVQCISDYHHNSAYNTAQKKRQFLDDLDDDDDYLEVALDRDRSIYCWQSFRAQDQRVHARDPRYPSSSTSTNQAALTLPLPLPLRQRSRRQTREKDNFKGEVQLPKLKMKSVIEDEILLAYLLRSCQYFNSTSGNSPQHLHNHPTSTFSSFNNNNQNSTTVKLEQLLTLFDEEFMMLLTCLLLAYINNTAENIADEPLIRFDAFIYAEFIAREMLIGLTSHRGLTRKQFRDTLQLLELLLQVRTSTSDELGTLNFNINQEVQSSDKPLHIALILLQCAQFVGAVPQLLHELMQICFRYFDAWCEQQSVDEELLLTARRVNFTSSLSSVFPCQVRALKVLHYLLCCVKTCKLKYILREAERGGAHDYSGESEDESTTEEEEQDNCNRRNSDKLLAQVEEIAEMLKYTDDDDDSMLKLKFIVELGDLKSSEMIIVALIGHLSQQLMHFTAVIDALYTGDINAVKIAEHSPVNFAVMDALKRGMVISDRVKILLELTFSMMSAEDSLTSLIEGDSSSQKYDLMSFNCQLADLLEEKSIIALMALISKLQLNFMRDLQRIFKPIVIESFQFKSLSRTSTAKLQDGIDLIKVSRVPFLTSYFNFNFNDDKFDDVGNDVSENYLEWINIQIQLLCNPHIQKSNNTNHSHSRNQLKNAGYFHAYLEGVRWKILSKHSDKLKRRFSNVLEKHSLCMNKLQKLPFEIEEMGKIQEEDYANLVLMVLRWKKLHNNEVDESGQVEVATTFNNKKSTSTSRTRRKRNRGITIMRSSNEVIDQWLQERSHQRRGDVDIEDIEYSDDDSEEVEDMYADLENFLVP